MDEKMVLALFQEKRKTEEIAQLLLGKLLVHDSKVGRTSGFIVETEAYLGHLDEAAHSFGGRRTKRTEVMFQDPGHIYTYLMHTHVLLNIITQDEGVPEGILIRVLEPCDGIELMEERRGRNGYQLTNGPGNLTKAMGIGMNYYGEKIDKSKLSIDPFISKEPAKIIATPRIGIPNKGIWTEEPLRLIVAGNPYVSRRKHPIDSTNGWLLEKEEPKCK